jgi:hypothetical protein
MQAKGKSEEMLNSFFFFFLTAPPLFGLSLCSSEEEFNKQKVLMHFKRKKERKNISRRMRTDHCAYHTGADYVSVK